jgi:hypothetical protein
MSSQKCFSTFVFLHLQVHVGSFQNTFYKVFFLNAAIALHPTITENGLQLLHSQLLNVLVGGFGFDLDGVLHLEKHAHENITSRGMYLTCMLHHIRNNTKKYAIKVLRKKKNFVRTLTSQISGLVFISRWHTFNFGSLRENG